ncbi:ribosome biogenesis protein WDR12 homolog [Dioscorea cayenensis subsp. rotundata]|uniref:Ribosome biogenesis protein WDR12 homolog n=1 Tax=Dioscorea cayennensis subsp. rotundata TaxID=55577 RepID=A0AB40CM44_DIOCR|nr:ribosome biogenesis protein WDR12 homolog [Dioscorea cayenensis subsp. rotundata]XP_039141102.1 ribosome biogenesis protein WDR12 homolog [Dioscorea cayenensis subsp. rotundata]
MNFNGSSSEGSRQVRVRFLTKMPPPLRAPTSAIAVPSNLTRMGLSEIVNLLLKNGNGDYQHQPFDFLVDGELIRMPLDQFLLAKGISAEKVLEIEYIKVVAPGKQQDPLMHDDWVSAVDGSNPSFILTGCYDGSARLWEGGESCSHVLGGHNGAITSVNIIKYKGIHGENNFHLATGSKDRTLRLWMLNAVEPGNYPVEVRAYKILKGHNSSVQSISAAPSGDMLCSGSWDCSIKLWDVKKPDTEDDSVSVKKRRVGSNTVYGEEPQFEAEAASTLVGHTQCVSSVVWPEADTIYSASWDHSIRQWDVETGKDPWNMVCEKVLNCLDVGGENSALVAAGGSDPILRIWDPRKPGTLAPVFQFASHSSWITACKWHPRSWFHLLSASYDGKVMLWDLRTAWPLAVIDSHKDKVLCTDWWKDDSVISGGADSKLCISSGVSIP